uniref:Uncharacterized protein n=1 Tax=viral metagenome TaxID=1070528 RepID=A0A6C0JJY7_9ZZZZ
MSNITFVTSFFNIYSIDNKAKYDNFIKLAESGIQICLYTDTYVHKELSNIISNFHNVKIMPVIELEDTIISKKCKKLEYSLPNNRNHNKDTEKYILSKYSKIELIVQTIIENPWNSTHFAWIDFSCLRIFPNKELFLNQLSDLSRRKFKKELFLIPGWWCVLNQNNIDNLLDNIYWRFLSKFFIADSQSIFTLFKLYQMHFDSFIREHKKLVWEINFLAWLESNSFWKPEWFLSDTNNLLINIPTRFYADCLDKRIEKTKYNYPQIENFYPSSAAYLYYNGKHYLNTRFINYSYTDTGFYKINHPKNTIITKNIFSELNNELIPIIHIQMSEKNIDLENHDMYSLGLEDIRLFQYNNRIKYIATNVNYIGSRSNRMIVGDYDLKFYEFLNSKIIEPPTQTHCEKNWIPLIIGEEEYFIYKWYPFELGKINYENYKLEIVKSYEIRSFIFHKVRGSTIFIDTIDKQNFIGVVHYCDETIPRQYFHMLVLLDKKTGLPISYSDPFCFQHYGVEFCIGFTIKNDKYVFWISKKDNDAAMVSINIDEIPMLNKVL